MLSRPNFFLAFMCNMRASTFCLAPYGISFPHFCICCIPVVRYILGVFCTTLVYSPPPSSPPDYDCFSGVVCAPYFEVRSSTSEKSSAVNVFSSSFGFFFLLRGLPCVSPTTHSIFYNFLCCLNFFRSVCDTSTNLGRRYEKATGLRKTKFILINDCPQSV